MAKRPILNFLKIWIGSAYVHFTIAKTFFDFGVKFAEIFVIKNRNDVWNCPHLTSRIAFKFIEKNALRIGDNTVTPCVNNTGSRRLRTAYNSTYQQ